MNCDSTTTRDEVEPDLCLDDTKEIKTVKAKIAQLTELYHRKKDREQIEANSYNDAVNAILQKEYTVGTTDCDETTTKSECLTINDVLLERDALKSSLIRVSAERDKYTKIVSDIRKERNELSLEIDEYERKQYRLMFENRKLITCNSVYKAEMELIAKELEMANLTHEATNAEKSKLSSLLRDIEMKNRSIMRINMSLEAENNIHVECIKKAEAAIIELKLKLRKISDSENI